MLCPLLNRKVIREERSVAIYAAHPPDDGLCLPAWKSAARTHVRRLQVLQSKCLRLATGAPWYVST